MIVMKSWVILYLLYRKVICSAYLMLAAGIKKS